MLILRISTKKSYFCDNDAIYDVIIQEPVSKWRHNHRHKISRDSFAELPLFKTFSLEKPILPFVALALFSIYNIPVFIFNWESLLNEDWFNSVSYLFNKDGCLKQITLLILNTVNTIGKVKFML